MAKNSVPDSKNFDTDAIFRTRGSKYKSNENEYEIDIRQIYGMLRRQYKLIGATFFFTIAAALLLTFFLVPQYTASALVLVDTSRKNLLDEANQNNAASADNARVESEVEIFRSDNILLSVIIAKNLVADPEFGVKLSMRDTVLGYFSLSEAELPTGQKALASVLNSLRAATTVRRRGSTYLISVGVEARSPERASELANALANAYVANQLQSKVDSALFGRDRIIDQSEDAQKSVILAEKALTEYLTNNIDQLAVVTGRADIAKIRDTIAALTAEKQKVSAEIASMRQSIQSKDWGTLAAKLENQSALELQRKRTELLRAEDTEAGGNKSTDAQLEIGAIESEIEKTADLKISMLENSLKGADAELTKARQSFSEIAKNLELPANADAEIYLLQQTARNATNSYQQLLARAQDLETQSAIQIADSRLISPALVPNSPSFPDKRLIFAVALLLAVGLGVALAFLREMFIGGFTNSEQLEAVTGLEVAAVLPSQIVDPSMITVADCVIDRPMSGYSEEVRRIRANLDLKLRSNRIGQSNHVPKQCSVIMVSSGLPSEGKSTVALSLARSYAMDHNKTLLIDCDLRRPSIHKQLALNPSSELIDYLRREPGKPLSQEFTTKDPKAPLTVIIGSRPSDMPTDHLLNDYAFAELLSSARKKFDYVIIDTPPVEPVVDGFYVAEHADAVVFVVHWAKTPQSTVTRSVNVLSNYISEKTEIFLVLNQDEQKGKLAKKYGGYYSES